MLLSQLKDKTVGIWGMGKEGKSAARFFPASSVIPIDKTLGNEDLETLKKCDVVIKSPGISKYNDLIVSAAKSGVVFTTGTNLFLAECRANGKSPVIIGVTGTKGKSTTSSLIYHGLKKIGKKVLLGGNIGCPLLDLLPVPSEIGYVVCEMSSYQCAELTEYVDYAVVLNLYKEHLDWHLSHDAYFSDKLNIVSHSLHPAIVNYGDAEIRKRLAGHELSYFNLRDGLSYRDKAYFDGDEKLLSKADVMVTGDHNRINFLAVLAVFKNLGIDIGNLKNVFADFVSLPHRLETIGEKDGVVYVDDSISTTPETAVAAMTAFLPRRIILLAGGFEREQDFTPLVDFVRGRQDKITVVCMYATGKRLYKQMDGLNAYYADDLASAMAIAGSLKKNGDIVLLSPASPSYGYFKNFEERGAEFKRLACC